MAMNKVDEFVIKMLITYPTLYRDRFDVMSDIVEGGSMYWDNAGSLQLQSPDFRSFKVVRTSLKNDVEKAENELELALENVKPLYQGFLTRKRKELQDYLFMYNNIECYATRYEVTPTENIHYWLLKLDHIQNFDSKYHSVNNKPEVVDEYWRKAIYEFFKQVLSHVNGLFGHFVNEDKTWIPRIGKEKIFNWAYDLAYKYQNEEERQRMNIMMQSLKKILDASEQEALINTD